MTDTLMCFHKTKSQATGSQGSKFQPAIYKRLAGLKLDQFDLYDKNARYVVKVLYLGDVLLFNVLGQGAAKLAAILTQICITSNPSLNIVLAFSMLSAEK